MDGGGDKEFMKENLLGREGLNQTKLWAIQGSKLTKTKVNIQQKSLFNATKLYSHTQPSPGRPSLPDHL